MQYVILIQRRRLNLLVALEEKSGEHQSNQDSSFKNHKCFRKIYQQSIDMFFKYFSLGQRSEAIDLVACL